jgi:hypothetical protein
MAAAFGHSLRLVDGDLAVEQGRLLEVDGIDNLVQALVLRILTPLGNDVFNTGYGFDARNVFTQPAGARMTRELIRLNLVRTLSPDPRLREVTAITFPDEPDGLAAPGGVDTAAAEARRRGRLCPCEISLRTVDGTAHALRVDVGI